jgi:hypothetical protein
MEVFAAIVMLVWIPVVLLLFAVIPAQRAVIIAFVGAWLFLPMAQYHTYGLPFLPDYTKMSATCAGVFLGALLFDAERVLRFRPHWIDLPMLLFCACPLLSSVTNGLGVWDGTSSALTQTVTWGLPYLIGRIYFTDLEGLRELAISIFVGGLLYVPICLFEARMSPSLHYYVYGFMARGVQMRFGGWRPAGFMDGGLECSMWMTSASLVGIWLWWTRALRSLHRIPAGWLVGVLLVTTILCRSLGALMLLFVGVAIMFVTQNLRTRLAILCLAGFPLTYIGLRAAGDWDAEEIVTLARYISKDRADSFQYRVDNENILIDKALEQPVFGWGGWNRSRIYDDWGKDVSVTDGLWIIQLGKHGFVGVVSGFLALALPMALLASRLSPRRLTSAEMAPALALAAVVSIYAIDCVPNAMVNPVYILTGGAVASYAFHARKTSQSTVRSAAQGTQSGTVPECIPPRRLYPART